MSLETCQQAITITLPSDPKQICVARTAVETFAARGGFARQDCEQIGLALNEALANVIKHGYRGDTGQSISVTMDMVNDEGQPAIKLMIKDHGRQVDPSGIKGRDLDDVRPGGLGVHIINNVMDQACYHRPSEGGMELTMIKRLDKPKGTKR